MTALTIYRETALPGTLQANSIYMVAPAARPDLVEMYVTGTNSSTVKRIIDKPMIEAMISDAVATSGGLEVVADIAERDALSPPADKLVLVLDASADATVTSGAATYAYRYSTSEWTKISESESLDVVLDWASITDKPSSTVADIDDAVTKRHTHANKTELDKVGEDGSGNLTYNGSLPATGWSSTGW